MRSLFPLSTSSRAVSQQSIQGRRPRRAALLAGALLVLSGCSSMMPDSGTPESRATVLNVVVNYLGQIVLGNEKQLNSFLLWPEYLEAKGQITKEQFLSQFEQAKRTWSRERHPLLGLDVKEVDVDGNEAQVVLQRPSSDDPEIKVELLWTGAGWMVVNDSIFGENNLLANATRGRT